MGLKNNFSDDCRENAELAAILKKIISILIADFRQLCLYDAISI